MNENGTLPGGEAAQNGEREKRPAEGRLLGMGRLNGSDEELEFILASIRAALESGTMSGQDATQAQPFALAQDATQPRLSRRDALQEQERAIVEEMLEREAARLEQTLGLAPRKVAQAVSPSRSTFGARDERWRARGPNGVRRKTDWTVDELYQTDFPEPKWIVPELLPTGLASLAGRPKLGKSWLALQLAAAVACGERFLDCDVEQGRVLFIALEDPPRRLRDRLGRLRVSWGAPIQFYTDWPPLNPGAGGVQELQQCVAEWQPRLVVIDTLARAFGRRIEWNSVSEATGALAGLQQVALEHDCCVLTVDHHKKPGALPDVIDDILGSTGKAAVIDTAWGLYREHSRRGATLKVTGRDIDDRELAVQFDNYMSCWQYMGDASASVRTAAEQEVYELLGEMGEADAGTLARELGKHRVTVRDTLLRLQSKGHVSTKEAPAAKRRGKKVLFYVPGGTTETSETTQ